MKVKKGPATSTARFIGVDLIGDVLYYPVWWYTKGLINTARACVRSVAAQEERLGVSIWISNIFTPMFGQYDWEGRLISFFARVVQIIVRGVALLVWAVLILGLVIVWLLLPLLIVYEIVANFFALFT